MRTRPAARRSARACCGRLSSARKAIWRRRGLRALDRSARRVRGASHSRATCAARASEPLRPALAVVVLAVVVLVASAVVVVWALVDSLSVAAVPLLVEAVVVVVVLAPDPAPEPVPGSSLGAGMLPGLAKAE